MKLQFSEYTLEAGVDEAGRGCLAGPVTAAAVILPQGFTCKGLTDSKQVSKLNRERLRPIIEEEALAWSVVHVNEDEIGALNILGATFAAMHRAIEQLKIQPEFIAIDGNRFPAHDSIPHQCIVKGDAKFLNIAAASILAKTHRDDVMEGLHEEFPVYAWNKNKGYPTKVHREGIKSHGPCTYHRPGFQLLPVQKQIPFDEV